MDRMYKIGLYEKAMPKDIGWKEKFQVAKSAGDDYIEISIDDTGCRIRRIRRIDEFRFDLFKRATAVCARR